jgi:hypothetical protein
MRLCRGKWFRSVVAELKRQGFNPGGMAIPHVVSSYRRQRVTVELRGGNLLRVLHGDRRVEEHRACDLAQAVRIIAQIGAEWRPPGGVELWAIRLI